MTVTYRSQFKTSMERDSWIEINLSSLEKNFIKLKELIKTDIMAVVKADAYGHGASAIAPVLQSLGVKSFGVATIDEGILLREIGIKTPILILGATPFWALESCFKYNLAVTIYSLEQLQLIEKYYLSKKNKLTAEIKIDTGMNRLGIDYENAEEIINKIINLNIVELSGIFSHLSDPKNIEFSKIQKERFDFATKKFKNLKKHLASSYAAINYEDFRYDLVRVGIALYGQEFNFLEPIISLKGRITEIHTVKKGEYVSYDRAWQALNDSQVATVPIGYADGVDRKLSNKIYGLYDDEKIKQIGMISMDQMMFDVSSIKNPKVNDVITLIGKEISINTWANILDTISYELVCRLKMRLPRIYTRD